MRSDTLIRQAHPYSRALLGLSLLLASLPLTALMPLLSGLLLTTLLLRMIDGDMVRVWRALRLLRWFIIPILLLHLLFTPGKVILPELGLALSWEGLRKGVELSLHLALMFMAALLMFRLLAKEEWYRLIAALPGVNRRLAVMMIILERMYTAQFQLLAQLRQQWQLRKRISAMPQLLLTALRLSLCSADQVATMVWLRWPGSLQESATVDYNRWWSLLLLMMSMLLLAGGVVL